jgi:hypothetical protein
MRPCMRTVDRNSPGEREGLTNIDKSSEKSKVLDEWIQMHHHVFIHVGALLVEEESNDLLVFYS